MTDSLLGTPSFPFSGQLPTCSELMVYFVLKLTMFTSSVWWSWQSAQNFSQVSKKTKIPNKNF